MTFEVKHGCFGYNQKMILNDISFCIERGEVLSILGSNGVGKTTLLKCMMGFLHWNTGDTLIDGISIKDIKQKDLWKKIAYVPQAKGSAFGYTALDMVILGRSAHIGTFHQPKKEDVDIALQAMKDVGILYLKDKLCTQMSGGELQMVLIARA
ncbi:MAG: ABC transporter ATP-binding protein, partial [Clostridium sp.]|nr:ABC transporter ATP-binding protein [Clostridium sp.]